MSKLIIFAIIWAFVFQVIGVILYLLMALLTFDALWLANTGTSTWFFTSVAAISVALTILLDPEVL